MDTPTTLLLRVCNNRPHGCTEGVVQTGSGFGCQGHSRSLRIVPFDRKQNFLYFLFPGPCAYLASFWSYGEKNEIAEKENWLLWQRLWKIRKSRFRSSSTAIAETNGKNRVKIRPVEVEIIGLTKIVKKEIKKYETSVKQMATW